MNAVAVPVILMLTVASLLAAPVGLIFAPFLAGLFLLSLAGVVGGVASRSVRRRDASLDARSWREGRT